MDKIQEFLNNITVIDTETTSINVDEAEIIELAGGKFINDDWQVKQTFLGSVHPIPPEASAVHYISNRMIEGLPIFDHQLDTVEDILGLKNSTYLVAHNAEYDRKVLEESFSRCFEFERFKEFSDDTRWICTWRLSKAIFGVDYENLQYNLSYLRYFLDLDVDDNLPAHRAKTDVITCGKLLEALIALGIEGGLIDSNQDIGTQLINICNRPNIIKKWSIGKKYQGCDLETIPNDYYLWALANLDCLNDKHANYDRDLAYSVELILKDRGVL